MSTSSVNRLPFALACLGGLAVSIYFLHPILMPFVLGALIAYLGDPLVDRLENRGFGRSAGVAAVFFLLSVLLLLILMIGTASAYQSVGRFGAKSARGISLAVPRVIALDARAIQCRSH